MIQFNLLPKVKLDYIKTKRNKRAVTLISTLVTVGALTLMILLLIAVQVVQRKYSSDLSKDIKAETAKLQAVPDLDKVLTIQNQLGSLTMLHAQKPVTTRLRPYIQQLTPAKASIASLQVDFVQYTMHFSGAANSLNTVNKFVDTLKFTDYAIEGQDNKKAFSDVVLSSFSRADKSVNYEIILKYDPLIFDSTNEVKLIVPNIITTRSALEKPNEDLFVPLPDTESSQE